MEPGTSSRAGKSSRAPAIIARARTRAFLPARRMTEF
jgi:hypothetical protein